MGLDNGIVLVRDRKPIRKDLFPVGTVTYNRNIEFAYWRKCWGIRYAILECLGGEQNGRYRYNISYFELSAIIDSLKVFLDKEYWNKYAESIFDYDSYRQTHLNNILNLEWLLVYKRKHPRARIYFYDSY